jgi:minichromosome maintenance protein 10
MSSLFGYSERKLSHDDFQEHLRGRYFIPPSLLYAIARPLPGNQGYDVPVDGDWVTTAVIAERGPVKLTSTPHTGEVGENKVSSKKFLTLKLVDLGMNNSSSHEKGTRGDALLNLLLFEATTSSKEVAKGTSSDRFAIKHYKGGSGGAFEACAALREGTILAIMNPRILKPFKVSGLISRRFC